jgi:exopolysaccharide production protein ExoY
VSPKRPERKLLRRLGDIVGASLLLAILAPLLALAALAVLVGSGRPIFFGHLRLGRGGRLYRCWKLRTMHAGAEARLEREPHLKDRYIRNDFKLPNGSDPRVTRIGRVLRRTYVDEIPQLLNVIEGSMSLIGPRPIVPAELAWYGPYANELLQSKPGVFGEWTSRGQSRPSYPERAHVELTYVRQRTIGADLAILIRTIPVVLRGQPDE